MAAKWEEKDVLQAVIVADSFNTRFSPLTLRQPRALLPMLDTPLLDYTIEFLARNGVKEIFVLCCVFAEMIKKHIDLNWKQGDDGPVINTFITPNALSVGDALREIDAHGVIRSDFILVSGDVISNCKLETLLQQHRTRSAKDKDAVMTMLFKETDPTHRIRTPEDDVIIALNKDTHQLLSLVPSGQGKIVEIPAVVFTEGPPKVQIRYNLLDCQVSICTPAVPMLFTDNFDYQSIRDLVKGILSGDEVSMQKIHVGIIRSEYAARVSNLQTYDAICKDIIHRWTYPLVPDVLSLGHAQTIYKRNHIYLKEDVILARSCTLVEDVFIGSGSSVGSEGGKATVLSKSVVGKNCKIGAGVVLENAYLWDNVTIEDDCVITKAILANGVVIKRGTTIGEGSVIANDVILGPNLVVPAGSKYAVTDKESAGWEDGEGALGDELAALDISQETTASKDTYSQEEVGKEGRGYLWSREDQLDVNDPESVYISWNMLSIKRDIQPADDDVSSVDSAPDMSEGSTPPPDDYALFYDEVLELIRTRIDPEKVEATPIDDVRVEVSSSRSANHVSPQEVTKAVLNSLVASSDVINDVRARTLYLKKVFVKFSGIFQNYIKTEDDQREALEDLEDAVVSMEYAIPSFQNLVHAMYEGDILEESVILEWYEEHGKEDDERRKKIHTLIKPFIEWLQTASEEEESEEEESEEESD